MPGSPIQSTPGPLPTAGNDSFTTYSATQQTAGNQQGQTAGATANQYTPAQQQLQSQLGGNYSQYMSGQVPTSFTAPPQVIGQYEQEFNNFVAPGLATQYGAGSPQIGEQASFGLGNLLANQYQQGLSNYNNAMSGASNYAMTPVGTQQAQNTNQQNVQGSDVLGSTGTGTGALGPIALAAGGAFTLPSTNAGVNQPTYAPPGNQAPAGQYTGGGPTYSSGGQSPTSGGTFQSGVQQPSTMGISGTPGTVGIPQSTSQPGTAGNQNANGLTPSGQSPISGINTSNQSAHPSSPFASVGQYAAAGAQSAQQGLASSSQSQQDQINQALQTYEQQMGNQMGSLQSTIGNQLQAQQQAIGNQTTSALQSTIQPLVSAESDYYNQQGQRQQQQYAQQQQAQQQAAQAQIAQLRTQEASLDKIAQDKQGYAWNMQPTQAALAANQQISSIQSQITALQGGYAGSMGSYQPQQTQRPVAASGGSGQMSLASLMAAAKASQAPDTTTQSGTSDPWSGPWNGTISQADVSPGGLFY